MGQRPSIINDLGARDSSCADRVQRSDTLEASRDCQKHYSCGAFAGVVLTQGFPGEPIYDLPRSRKDHMMSITHHQKRLNRYPGILIGRIAVNERYSGKGIGSEVLDFIKEWAVDDTFPSECRFVIVDAVNDTETLRFYIKNDFVFLFSSELQEETYTSRSDRKEKDTRSHPRTRIMYYDLLDW